MSRSFKLKSTFCITAILLCLAAQSLVCVKTSAAEVTTESGKTYFVDEYATENLGRHNECEIACRRYYKILENGAWREISQNDESDAIHSYPFVTHERWTSNTIIDRLFTGVPDVDISQNTYNGLLGNYVSYKKIYTGDGEEAQYYITNATPVDSDVILVEDEDGFVFHDASKSISENKENTVFENVGTFRDGKAIAKLNGDAVLVDTRGNVLKNYGKDFLYVGDYQHGYIFARTGGSSGSFGCSSAVVSTDTGYILGDANWRIDTFQLYADRANSMNYGGVIMNENGDVVLSDLYCRFKDDIIYNIDDIPSYSRASLMILDQTVTKEGYLITVNGGEYLFANNRFTSNHKYGVVDLNGKTVVDFNYNGYQRIADKYTVMFLDCGFEIFDENFNKIVVFYNNDYLNIFEYIDDFGLFILQVYGRYSIIDVEGNILASDYKDTSYVNDGYFSTRLISDSTYRYMLLPQIGVVSPEDAYMQIRRTGDNYIVEKDGKSGIVNPNNEVLLPIIYDKVEPFSDAAYIVGMDGKTGIVDINGGILLPIEYYGVERLTDTDKNIVKVKESETGNTRLFDLDSGDFFDVAFDSIEYIGDLDSNWYMITDDGRSGVIDDSGEIIEPMEHENIHSIAPSLSAGDLIIEENVAEDKDDGDAAHRIYIYSASTDKVTDIGVGELDEIDSDLGVRRLFTPYSSADGNGSVVVYDEDMNAINELTYEKFRLLEDGTGPAAFYLIRGDGGELCNANGETIISYDKTAIYSPDGAIIAYIGDPNYSSVSRIYRNAYIIIGEAVIIEEAPKNIDGADAVVKLERPLVRTAAGVEYLDEINYAFRARIVDGELWLCADGIGKALGCNVETGASDLSATIAKDGVEIRLEAGSNQALVNGRPYTLKTAPRHYGWDTLALPTYEIAELLGVETETDGDTVAFYY